MLPLVLLAFGFNSFDGGFVLTLVGAIHDLPTAQRDCLLLTLHRKVLTSKFCKYVNRRWDEISTVFRGMDIISIAAVVVGLGR